MVKSISIENLQVAFEQNNLKLIQYITQQINNIETINFRWVEELPTENISTNTIYLVKHILESEEDEKQQEENLEIELLNNELIEELPKETEPDIEIITSINNIYDEYVYNKNTGWELINTIDTGNIHIKDYYTKTEIDDLLECTDEEINNAIIDSINVLNKEEDNNDTSTN
jgi:hypothetical protein